MTERELLELAAKAAGYEWKWDQPRGSGRGWLRIREGDRWPMWRPHADDGEALRLAVKLHISVYADDESYVFAVTQGGRRAETLDPETHLGWCECWSDDPAAATRRAVLRAAAEIGKALP